MEYTLIVLAPPGNVESSLGQLQTRLFGEAGFSAALALPAIMPLCYLPGAQARSFFKLILKEVGGAGAGFPITLLDLIGIKESGTGIQACGKSEEPQQPGTSLFFRVGLAEPGLTILKAIKAAGQRAQAQAGEDSVLPVGPRPLPLFEFGFFLGQEPADISEQQIKQFKELLSPLPAFQFSLFTYELLKLRVAEPPRLWYQEVFWEVLDQHKVRRSL